MEYLYPPHDTILMDLYVNDKLVKAKEPVALYYRKEEGQNIPNVDLVEAARNALAGVSGVRPRLRFYPHDSKPSEWIDLPSLLYGYMYTVQVEIYR